MNQVLTANTARFAGATTIRTVGVSTVTVRPSSTVTVSPSLPSQSGWRWCQKCQGLFFSGNPDQGVCPAGGRHDASRSGAYLMTFGDGGEGMQAAWRWCQKCQGLFFSGNPDQGACPAGGRHNASRSGAYLMIFGDGGEGMQATWRWCQKCQELFFSGNPDQGACPAGAGHDASRSGAYSMRFDPNPPPPKPASLPLVSSRNGNLFQDRNDPDLHWCLPDFNLADDVDPGFAFAASQSGQDGSGNPFNKARLTLRLHKSQPDDVVQFSKANPNAKLQPQEITLAELSASLTTSYTDHNGQEQQKTFVATIVDAGNGDFVLTVDPILGPDVILVYQDLTLFGKAVINLSASYQAWAESGALFLIARRSQALSASTNSVVPMNMSMLSAQTQPAAVAQPAFFAKMDMPSGIRQRTDDSLVQTSQAWAKQLPIGLKYEQDGYQLKYTISTDTVTNHVIRDAHDLSDFSLSQSEFTELKAIDVSQYATISKLYMGVLSRTIVMIPRRYSITRGRAGCAALCVAVVDSSSGSGSKCKFEFDFTIAPEVSRIEVYKLAQEINSRQELKGYKLKLPDFQKDSPPSTLDTQFRSDVQINQGPLPQTFVVTVSIEDEGVQTPAVANANAFIMRLSSGTGADLIGSLSIKLDDGYPQPVLSTIDLNFARTAGTDHEIDVQLIEETSQIKLTNQLPLDLQASRYALLEGSSITEVPGSFALPANGSLNVPLPGDHADLTLAVDAELLIPQPMAKSDITKFLDIRTADVQETQYVVAVNGSGIDYNKVDSVGVNITFANLPNVAPRTLQLSKNIHADSTHIVIPLENAVFALPGTANVAVHFVDPTTSDLNFTLENDFATEPVLIILQSNIDNNVPKTQP